MYSTVLYIMHSCLTIGQWAVGTASWSGAGFRGDWLAHSISPVLQPSDMQTFCLIFFVFFLFFSFASCPAGPTQPAHPSDEPIAQFHSIPIASRHPCVHPSSHPRFVATHCPIHPSLQLPTPTLHYLRNIRPSSHLASSSLTGKSWQGVSTSALSTTVSCPVGGGGGRRLRCTCACTCARSCACICTELGYARIRFSEQRRLAPVPAFAGRRCRFCKSTRPEQQLGRQRTETRRVRPRSRNTERRPSDTTSPSTTLLLGA